MELRESIQDEDVVLQADMMHLPLEWLEWVEVMMYTTGEAPGWNNSMSEAYAADKRRSVYLAHIPEYMAAAGVYEWKCVLTKDDEEKSVVFYLGESVNVKQRIGAERRLDNAGCRQFAVAVLDLITTARDPSQVAMFCVRFAPAPAGMMPRLIQDNLLAKFDYAANQVLNGDLRINDAIDEIGGFDEGEDDHADDTDYNDAIDNDGDDDDDNDEDDEDDEDQDEDEDEDDDGSRSSTLSKCHEMVNDAVAQAVGIMEDLPEHLHDLFKEQMLEVLGIA
jgi:hypothetical protein